MKMIVLLTIILKVKNFQSYVIHIRIKRSLVFIPLPKKTTKWTIVL